MGIIKDRNSRIVKITALVTILAVICTCSTVSAANLRVNSTEEGNYTSIQAAVDAAKPEDTIFISPGTYVENLKIDKQVRIWSDSRKPEDTVIRAADSTKNTVEITADRVSFSGFGIEGSEKAGISLTEVKNCFINNNKAQGAEYGIFLTNSESNTISDNIITLNEKGIRLESSTSNTIQDNIIAYNYGFGISIDESKKNVIYNNYFKNSLNVEENVVNVENIWQSPLVTKQNIVRGPYIAGNFWADLEGRGYSETCADENKNGICDTSYNLTGGGIDKSPLFPKFPNSVKILENKLNSSASAYEEEIENEKVENEKEKTDGTNESSSENTTEANTSEEETPGPGLGIVATAWGAAYFLRREG
ncbi:MAG: right-handed parallel beta-helix repeat-containing protein [Methanosarcina sp.]|uniref:right-handed parallel beta-helix repeat-containing protein n=1 Tax=Methanosarcina sp. TaxID=2213 RepID=UPI003BB53290